MTLRVEAQKPVSRLVLDRPFGERPSEQGVPNQTFVRATADVTHRMALPGRSQVRFGSALEPIDPLRAFLSQTFTNSYQRIQTGGDIILDFSRKADISDNKMGPEMPSGERYQVRYFHILDKDLGFKDKETQTAIILAMINLKLLEVNESTTPKQVRVTPKGHQAARMWQEEKVRRLLQQGGPKLVPVNSKPLELGDLASFVTNLNEAARKGELPPLIGRDDEILKIERTLRKWGSKNVILVGEPGVGKTALVQGLAQRIVKGEVSPGLRNKQIFQVSLGQLVAGTRYRGDMEERLNKLVKFAESHPEALLFMDEFQGAMNGGASDGGLTLGNLLKPFLGSPQSQLIAATTQDEYHRILEKDGATKRRVKPVFIQPPNQLETLKILSGLREPLESYHDVRYPLKTLKEVVRLTGQFLPTLQFPNKAIDVMDEAGVRAVERGSKVVSRNDVAQVVSEMANIPLGILNEDEKAKLLRLEEILHKRIIGQNQAIGLVSQAIRTRRTGLIDAKGPAGKFIFLGASGVGKTELAKALAEWLTGDEKNLIRIDMGGYSEKHSVSRLIGAPPGYVGYEEGGELTGAVRKRPYSVVLLDEVEKAHPEIFNAVLEMLDDGYLKDGQGKVIDFRNTIVIMTSNLGSRQAEALGKKQSLGFTAGNNQDALVEKQAARLQDDLLREFFRPEFLNRVDDVVFFPRLTSDEQTQVINLHLNKYLAQIQQNKGITVTVTPEAQVFLANLLFQPSTGTAGYRQEGRKATDILQRHLINPLSNTFLTQGFAEGDHVTADLNPDKTGLTFKLAPQ